MTSYIGDAISGAGTRPLSVSVTCAFDSVRQERGMGTYERISVAEMVVP